MVRAPQLRANPFYGPIRIDQVRVPKWALAEQKSIKDSFDVNRLNNQKDRKQVAVFIAASAIVKNLIFKKSPESKGAVIAKLDDACVAASVLLDALRSVSQSESRGRLAAPVKRLWKRMRRVNPPQDLASATLEQQFAEIFRDPQLSDHENMLYHLWMYTNAFQLVTDAARSRIQPSRGSRDKDQRAASLVAVLWLEWMHAFTIEVSEPVIPSIEPGEEFSRVAAAIGKLLDLRVGKQSLAKSVKYRAYWARWLTGPSELAWWSPES